MYHFAIVMLLALAAVKLTDFLVDLMGERDGMRSILTFALTVAGVWAMDYSVFDGWGVALRDRTIGVWMTGLMVAGATTAVRALFGYLTHDRATVDESLGEHRPLRKVA